MSDKTLARRTEIKLIFKDKDISKELSDYLLSFTFTDKEEDETDDISISLEDREGNWIKNWLNTNKGGSTATTVQTEVKAGNIVQFTGGPVYISSTATEPTTTKAASKCKCTVINGNGTHPYHLISQDGKGVYGWVDSSSIERETVAVGKMDTAIKAEDTEQAKSTKSGEKKAFKGTEIHAMIIQKNPYTDGKDKILDCGFFEIDEVGYSGPPEKVTIKATSIPYKSTFRKSEHSQAWENTALKNIGSKIAKRNGMEFMYLSSYNPVYKRKEQKKESDIAFLSRLCKSAGISLKVTSKTIVMFDAADYEKKSEVVKIKAGKGNILDYNFHTKTANTAYSTCHVSYTDPKTEEIIEAEYTPDDAPADGQTLEIEQKVSSEAEALELAKKMLRARNKGESTAEFTLVGDVGLVVGITVRVYGYGEFNGKYIIEEAAHNVTGGYTTNIRLRSCLEGY